MTLTAEKYEQIMASLKSDKMSAHMTEKRQSPRVGTRLRIEIVPFTRDQPLKREVVWLRDLSATGIGFIHVSPINPGSPMILCLRRGRHDLLKLLYQVVRSERIDEHQYIIGARFDRALEETGASSADHAAQAPATATPAILTPSA